MKNMLNKAIMLHKKGRVDEALEIYTKFLKSSPSHPDALHLAGLACLAKKNAEKAVDFLQKACNASNVNALFLCDLGKAFLSGGKPAKAVEKLKAATEINRDYGEAYFFLGTALKEMGNMVEAAEAFENASRLNARAGAARFNAGMASFFCRDYSKAQSFFARVVKEQPGNADAHRFLGACLFENGVLDLAEQETRRAIELNGKNPESFYYMGNIYREKGEFAGAIENFKNALLYRPDYVEAKTNMGETYQVAGHIDRAYRIYNEVTEQNPRCALAVSNKLLCMNYSDSFDNEQLFDAHVKHIKKCYPRALRTNPRIKNLQHKSVRLGYVSPDFRRHSVAYFIEPVLEHHDKSMFEIFCYANVGLQDEVSARFKRLAHWRNIFQLCDEEAARWVQKDAIDILIDLTGHTRNNRLGLFALKPAGVQVTYIGYPNTTGLESIDYRITDAHSDPPGVQKYYTEKLVRLEKGFLCYKPPINSPVCDTRAVEKRKQVVFGSFNNIAKISAKTFDVWSKILDSVADSKLILKYRFMKKEFVAHHIIKEFEKRGIERNRIECLDYVQGTGNHLDLYNDIDIALDTFPYNGTTTTCEALWMGVPVVVLAGNRHASRVGVSLLNSLGHKNFIASDEQEYVAIVKKLAADRGSIIEHKKSLREIVRTSSLCDAKNVVVQLEQAYRAMLNNRNL